MLTLACEGCHIIASDINFKGARQTTAVAKALERKSVPVKADVSDSVKVETIVMMSLD